MKISQWWVRWLTVFLFVKHSCEIVHACQHGWVLLLQHLLTQLQHSSVHLLGCLVLALFSSGSTCCIIHCQINKYFVDLRENLRQSLKKVWLIIKSVMKYADSDSTKIILLELLQNIRNLWMIFNYDASSLEKRELIEFMLEMKWIKWIAVTDSLIQKTVNQWQQLSSASQVCSHLSSENNILSQF